ncbi:hypothetical protein Y032_0012g1673 [Ancylostoma ceylanicum]|uniref:Uncharacterized protein n=1 Tax=Ancylostoma ceylanicum TaxID=53326 RepID=A0A016VEC4_9BILA|nr:hypothetical protein Y032_0012g1673 [Ancylostoma ceylanicum]
MMLDGQRMGCVELLNSVCKRIKPKYHVFSHIHEGYGCTSDGYTKFINCCICNENLEQTVSLLQLLEVLVLLNCHKNLFVHTQFYWKTGSRGGEGEGHMGSVQIRAL